MTRESRLTPIRSDVFGLIPMCLVVAASCTACRGVNRVPGDAKHTSPVPEAQKVVDAVCASLKQLQALRMDVLVTDRERTGLLGIGARTEETNIRLEVLMALGGRFRVAAYDENGHHLATVVGDGQTLFEADLRNKKWTKYPYRWDSARSTGLLLLRDETPLAFQVSRYSQSWVGADSRYSLWLRGLLEEGGLQAHNERTDGGTETYVLTGTKKMRQDAMAVKMKGTLVFDAETKLPLRQESQNTATLFLLPAFHSHSEFVWA